MLVDLRREMREAELIRESLRVEAELLAKRRGSYYRQHLRLHPERNTRTH